MTLSLFVGVTSASAQSLFVRDPAEYLGYGYDNSSWTTYTSMWNTTFGAGNITQGSTLGSLAGYSAVMLDPSQPNTSAYNLSAGEISTLTNFLAGGGRLYMFGENGAWDSWNASILSIFGASASGYGADGGTPLVSDELTAGVSSIDTPAPGNITDFNGGIDLFSNHFAGVFDSDAIVVLDINICDDEDIGTADNRAFCQNIINFTAGAPLTPPNSTVPEPASITLLATGMVGMLGARRKWTRR